MTNYEALTSIDVLISCLTSVIYLHVKVSKILAIKSVMKMSRKNVFHDL